MNNKIENIINNINPETDFGIINIELLNIVSIIDNINTDDLVNRIQKDPNVVFRILKTVNSPYFYLTTKIKSIEHAVIYLGRREIKKIIVLASLIDISEKLGISNVENSMFIDFSVKVARTSERIVKKFEDSTIYHPEDAFICGLLICIGKIILKKVYPQVINEINDFWISINIEKDRERFGTDFIEISSYFLKKFHLEYFHEVFQNVFDWENTNFLSNSLSLALLIVNLDSHDEDILSILTRKNLINHGGYDMKNGIIVDIEFIRNLEKLLHQ